MGVEAEEYSSHIFVSCRGVRRSVAFLTGVGREQGSRIKRKATSVEKRGGSDGAKKQSKRVEIFGVAIGVATTRLSTKGKHIGRRSLVICMRCAMVPKNGGLDD